MAPPLASIPSIAPLIVVVIVLMASVVAPPRPRATWRLLLINLIGFLVDTIAVAVDGGTLVAVLYSALCGALHSGAAIVIA